MRKTILSLLSMIPIWLLAQSNVSAPMNFHIERGIVPPILSIVPGTMQFVEEDNNGVIDANERCKIRFQVENTGRGDGYACVAKVSAEGDTQGITCSDIPLPTIHKDEKQWVEVPICANSRVVTGELDLTVYVDEPNGFGTEKNIISIGTHELRTPLVKVVDYKIVGNNSGVLERRKPFHLQMIVQNMDQGEAKNVGIKLELPRNVSRIAGDIEHTTLQSLAAGESHTFDYELIANQEAAEYIDVHIDLSEEKGRYAQDENIPLKLGQPIGGMMKTDIVRNDLDADITKKTLHSDVDENIPISKNINNKTFVVIIANENYQSVASVPYALNDGRMFSEYCKKTLGIPEKNIHYKPDATGNQIKGEVTWLENITGVFDDAQIIFYYAGHGIPDESSRTAYLLPVDGISTNISTGYKLDDLYSSFGKMNATKVMVFMDACFSGSKRENGMLASARGVALKAKNGVPQGNMVVFSAAQGDETAYPNREKQHGMFTYYLLKKLQETKGDVTLQDLGEFVTTNVKQQSIVLNGKLQTPCVIPSTAVGEAWGKWTLK